MISKPALDTIPKYYHHYFSLVQDADLLQALQTSRDDTTALLSSISEEKSNFRYAEGKWSVKEVMNHIVDAERVFSYRALRFSRRDNIALEGFDENTWVPNANTASRTLSAIADEYLAVRQASIELFRYMNDEMLDFEGSANNWKISPRSIGWVLTGHNVHHCNILKERYL